MGESLITYYVVLLIFHRSIQEKPSGLVASEIIVWFSGRLGDSDLRVHFDQAFIWSPFGEFLMLWVGILSSVCP